jgi:glutamyl-tRNA reductase
VTAVAGHTQVDPELWEEFHRLVNMSSRELFEWLRMSSAQENAEELPEHAGSETGRKVLRILQKRRVDLTDDDEKVMRKVVERIRAERGDDLEPTAGQENWRHRLMTIGHDPLKPPR